jgi:hypothetical protein
MFAAEIVYRSWVATNGYRWIRYKDVGKFRGMGIGGVEPGYYDDYPGHVLTEIYSQTNDSPPRRYRPCDPFKDRPTLFREFAAIRWDNAEDILAFASRYGMLDSNVMMGAAALRLPDGIYIRKRQGYVPADPEEDWLQGPAILRMMIRVWENLSNPTELANTLRWIGHVNQGCWVWYPVPTDGPTRDEDKRGLVPTMIYRSWDTPDFISEDEGKRSFNIVSLRPWLGTETIEEVAHAFIRQELSKQIGYHQCTMRLNLDENEQSSFQVIPGNMLQALYLQFGQAYLGNEHHRKCPVCHDWFKLVPQDKGKKEYCKPACKVREYRNRIQRAEELRRQGKTPKQIAEAIDTPLETVKGWLKKKTQKRKDD